MRILFITANRLGDAVISTGLLSELLRRHPQAEVTVACGPVAASLFEPCQQVVRVIAFTKRRWDLHWYDLWRKCVGTRWDLAVDLRGSGLTFALRSRVRRILRGGRRPGRRLGHVASLFHLHPVPLPVTWSTDAQRRTAQGFLPRSSRWLALAPTANWDGKIWPPERFVRVAQTLEREGLRPVLFYGPGAEERKRAQPVLDALPDAINLGGARPIGEVAALLGQCALFIGNDSGLMHVAAATSIPTLGLFGPSRASEYAPGGLNASFVEAPGIEGVAPIDGLSVDTVLAAARTRLSLPRQYD
ncbi:glycosyltransferase family 9 protein [Brytella acorum]|uniref:Glycosyltransferase family 9 protein n=1 Tax=Brytella acorum TaxID=2959299 RepID=A0AA35XWY5_9PROT|nr:glycosyltransferase family 9 protein [Brytella acorum]MDF3624433.1 glycosyltransferase family 9 protein [Brytella acorum]CAI9119717.1 glycosyltransferase family 9 protein [Brytella acorum]